MIIWASLFQPVYGSECSRILEDERFEWETIEGTRTRVHFQAGSFASSIADSLILRAEGALQYVLDTLGFEDYERRVDVFYINNREEMAWITGTAVTGYAYYRDDVVVLVFSDEWRAFERHEMTHVVTLRKWGRPGGAAIVEGVAAFIDGCCGGYEIGRIARTSITSENPFDLEELVDGFAKHDDLVDYARAAAVVEYTYRRLGGQLDMRLWRSGLISAPDILGVSCDRFELEFVGWINAEYDPLPAADWQTIRTLGCGAPVACSG